KPGEDPEINIALELPTLLSPEALHQKNEFYKITFSDSGIGFDDQFSESIFKVFTRLHTSSEYSGSGVGLALCRKIMSNHGGYITAEGNPGVGATFNLYFQKIQISETDL
ncbi:MAG: ATP-binding protein, partial [Flavitalea sp.]